jgi:hypothetical protein
MAGATMMNDGDLAALIRGVVRTTEQGGLSVARRMATRLRQAGIVAGAHVGDPAFATGAASSRMVAEWYAGQFLYIVEGEQWFAMNSLLNSCDRFVPAPTPPPPAVTPPDEEPKR